MERLQKNYQCFPIQFVNRTIFRKRKKADKKIDIISVMGRRRHKRVLAESPNITQFVFLHSTKTRQRPKVNSPSV